MKCDIVGRALGEESTKGRELLLLLGGGGGGLGISFSFFFMINDHGDKIIVKIMNLQFIQIDQHDCIIAHYNNCKEN